MQSAMVQSDPNSPEPPSEVSAEGQRVSPLNRDLLAELDQIQEEARSRRVVCKVHRALDWIAPELRDDLAAAFSDNTKTAVAIATWLTREGFAISDRSIQRYRSQGCTCVPVRA